MKKTLFAIFFLFLNQFSIHSFEAKKGDIIIENLNPPSKYWEVPEGSCGEACVWSVANYLKIKVSQKEINQLSKAPNRGIHSEEVIKVLKKLKIQFQNQSSNYKDAKKFIAEKIISNLKIQNPILLGVKIYPDEYPKWVCDHFILIVGYNEETSELIYNSNADRERISISKLLNKKEGYSILHKSNYIYSLSIELNK